MSTIKPAGNVDFAITVDGYWEGTVLEVRDNDATTQTLLEDITGTEGDLFLGKAYGGTAAWAAATLRRVQAKESPTRARIFLTLSYSEAPFGTTAEGNPASTQPDNTPLYSLRESGLELPISTHPDYMVMWDHDLVVKLSVIEEDEETLGFILAEWEAATKDIEGVIPSPEAYAADTKWIQAGEVYDDPDSSGNNWRRYRRMTKRDVEVRIVPGPQVVETAWFNKLSDAVTYATGLRRGTIAVPGETFGIADGAWLVLESSLAPDGERWQFEAIYQ